MINIENPDDSDEYEFFKEENTDEVAEELLIPLLNLSENPLLDDALILRLTYDLVTRLHSPRAIAIRYGFLGVEGLREYLEQHPEVVAEAHRLGALFASDANAEERVRQKFIYATERLVLPIAHLASDPKTPLAARIDAFKQIQRGAGMDGLSQTQRAAIAKGEGGQPFTLTINFAGGRITGPVTPLTIEATTTGSEDTGETRTLDTVPNQLSALSPDPGEGADNDDPTDPGV